MAGKSADPVFHQVERLFNVGTVGMVSDAQLLDWFVSSRDESAEVAFEELMLRHGPIRPVMSILQESVLAIRTMLRTHSRPSSWFSPIEPVPYAARIRLRAGYSGWHNELQHEPEAVLPAAARSINGLRSRLPSATSQPRMIPMQRSFTRSSIAYPSGFEHRWCSATWRA